MRRCSNHTPTGAARTLPSRAGQWVTPSPAGTSPAPSEICRFTGPPTVAWSTGGTMTSRALSTLAILFLLFDSIAHLLMPAPVVQAMATLGFPANTTVAIGLIELVLVALYAVPRTSIAGAILLTGYLGGAVAAKVRIGAAPFDTVFPI